VKFFRSIFGKNASEPVKPRPAAAVEAGPDPVLAALAELEVKRLREALAASSPAPTQLHEPVSDYDFPSARPNRVVKAKAPLNDRSAGPSVSIWDVEDNEVAKYAAPAAAEPERRRPTRSKTRILGFEMQPASVVPLFDDGDRSPVPVAPAAPGQGYVMFPTGWVIVKKGPGRGTAFALAQGVSQIGRGSDQTIALDFGDMAISRQNHAAVAYDAGTHRFHIGHGGKSNLVRLNGRPLLSTEVIGDGDEIQIGETTLLVKVLCSPSFNWSASDAGEDGHDVAIA
jgi:FHA domain